jgi:ribosomal protein S18 acetylase RimI-like enzyme
VGALHVLINELHYLVTAPNFRRQGIARALLATSKRPGRWAKVMPSNQAVIRLLETEGFVYDPDRLTAGCWIAYVYR